MSEHLMLTPLDGAHRVRLDEAAWAGLVGDELGSCLPPWAAPLPDDVPPDVVDPHPALLQALEIPQRALVTVEVASSTGSTGLRAVQWTDGAFVLGIVRAVVLDDAATPGHGARLAPGIELTAGPIDGLLGEIMRLVPPELTSPRSSRCRYLRSSASPWPEQCARATWQSSMRSSKTWASGPYRRSSATSSRGSTATCSCP